MSEDAKKEDGGAEGAEGAAKPKGKKKLLIIIVAAVLLIGGAAGFFLMGKKAPEGEQQAEPQEKEKHYELAELPTIIVNLGESTSFLKVTMLMEYDPEVIEKAEAKKHGSGKGGGKGGGHGGGEGGEKKGGGSIPGIMEERMPMIKDAIIRVLSSRRADDVLTSEGKEKLKEELIEAINEASGFDEPPVIGIFFTEFIVQ